MHTLLIRQSDMKKLIPIIILTLAGLLAQSQVHYEVTHIDGGINTTGSETGAIVVDDSILLYTTMQGEESSRLYLIEPPSNKHPSTPTAH